MRTRGESCVFFFKVIVFLSEKTDEKSWENVEIWDKMKKS